MTREEAIYRLKNTAWLGTDKDRTETEQAVDMAIESLQSDAVPIQEVKLKDGFKIDDIDENYEPKIVGNAKFVRSKCEVTDLISRADAVQGFRGGKIPPKEMLDGTVLIPKHQWIEMERELANLKEEFESADAEWIPCSERLPSEEDCPMDCMVTRRSKFIGNYVDMAVAEKNGTWTHEDWKAISHGDVESGRKTGLINTRDDEIIAWMPLPAPYKGGDDE